MSDNSTPNAAKTATPAADAAPNNAADGPQITLSPFYHSAVSAVTKPQSATWCSNYFVDRWMPLLGGNGTLIVMALRRGGFLNRKTGERRDEIVIGRAELAAAAGMSEDTLTRELGINKKTGQPQNPWLHQFVQKRIRSRRDAQGRVWREESAYWVAMDDPIHPEDWPLVEQAVRAAEERLEKQIPPKTHSASSVGAGTPHFASSGPQSAERTPQSAEPKTQNASAQKDSDSSILLKTLKTPAAPGVFASLSSDGSSGGGSASQEGGAFPEGERAYWEEEAREWFRANGVSAPSARSVRHTAEARWNKQRKER